MPPGTKFFDVQCFPAHSITANGLFVSSFVFYIFDIDEWNSRVGNVFRFLFVTAIFSLFVILVVLKSNELPFGIINLYAVLLPLWLILIGALFYKSRDTRTFVSWTSGPLLLVMGLVLVSWLVWVFLNHDNEWNSVTRIKAAVNTGCEPNFEEYPNCFSEDGSGDTCFYLDHSGKWPTLAFPENCDHACLNVYEDCSNGLILWVGPLLISLSMLFLSFFCTFLRTKGAIEQDIVRFGKLWFFVLFIMWAISSLSGAAGGVTSSLSSLTVANLVGGSIFLGAIFTKEDRKQSKQAMLAGIKEKYGNDNLNVVRGLFIVTCSPFLFAYFTLSAINQLVRRIGINPCAQPSCAASDSDQNAGIVTVRAKKHITKMRSWDRVKVLTYAIYWGIAYMILQVLVANLTVVFLSYMIETTAGFGIGAVTAIMAAVGVTMFLLPPVPGVPVYLTLGIVLAAQGNQIFGWTGSILYATGIGVILKLFSSALQQKLIGENLSHFVPVRQFVGVNSKLMKAMRLVLGKGGLSVPKVAILIGGPDWPTSVLCGIMRISICQIMLGTTPIVFLIFPTCLTGALLYMASLRTDTGNPFFPWARTASTLTASATALVQFSSMIVAAYYLEQTAEKRADEVKAIDDDKEVKEADIKEEQVRKCYETVTQWNVLPLLPKLTLISSLTFITASCYMVQFFSTMCFAEHSLTDSVYENLGGNVANLFLPLGWAAVALFGLSVILLSMFSRWGNVSTQLSLLLIRTCTTTCDSWLICHHLSFSLQHEAKKLNDSGKTIPLNNSSDIS
ncbi:hypothetical protein ACHAWF_018056 [Thalassiosira exigua]